MQTREWERERERETEREVERGREMDRGRERERLKTGRKKERLKKNLGALFVLSEYIGSPSTSTHTPTHKPHHTFVHTRLSATPPQRQCLPPRFPGCGGGRAPRLPQRRHSTPGTRDDTEHPPPPPPPPHTHTRGFTEA